MSECEPAETNLPLPFLAPDHKAHRLFGFGHQSKEESFEHFDFPANMNTISSPMPPQPSTEQPVSPVEAVTVKIIKAKRQTHTRNYKLYAGNTVFFCGGRFLTSRALWAFCISLVLLCGPCILFLIFTCPWLWYHISPAIPIVFAYIFSITLASMLKTSWTDPGILPRNLDGQNQKNTMQGDSFGYRYSSMSDYNAPEPKEVIIKGEHVRLKYCETCCIYRPPRASHCRQCDNCVEIEDHHCIWLNNCIGKRNYTTFFIFITGSALSCCYVIAFSLSHVIILCLETNDRSFIYALSKAPVSFFITLFCLVLLLPISGLTSFHCFLIMRGVTTHEQIRANIASTPFQQHPFDLGNPFKNMFYKLCRPHNKSYIARRKYAEEIYEIKLPSNNNAIIDSNLSTVQDDFAQSSTLKHVIASGLPL